MLLHAHSLRQRRGSKPVLIVAPHGGRRQPERRLWTSGSVRVNDLHTAEIAVELAEALDADALLNTAIDRNDLDLNRIAQVRARAPWFLDALAERLEDLSARHSQVTVLFVHGWNVVNPACDCGLGIAPPSLTRDRLDRSAVDARFFADRVTRLREACARRGITTGLGWRYPASSANNLVQLFTGRYASHADPRLRRLACTGGRANAVQLELAIPLRWPGVWRSGFVDACVETFGRSSPAPTAAANRSVTRGAARREATRTPPVERLAVQFHDANGGVAGIATWDADGTSASARLLLLPADGGLFLYTAEAEAAGTDGILEVGPLTVCAAQCGDVTLRYRGPLLRFSDASPFLDLEQGLARATLCEASVDLQLSRTAPHRTTKGFANVTGHVQIADHRGRAGSGVERSAYSIAGHGFTDGHSHLRAGRRLTLTIPEAPIGPLRIIVPRSAAARAHRYESAGPTTLTTTDVAVGDARGQRSGPLIRCTIHPPGTVPVDVTGEAMRRVPIVRQAPGGRTTQHVLALCRFVVGGMPAGAGWAEVSDPP